LRQRRGGKGFAEGKVQSDRSILNKKMLTIKTRNVGGASKSIEIPAARVVVEDAVQ